MAGVGFELKKLFKGEGGYIKIIKAYSISAVVTEGPMVLSVMMLFALRYLLIRFGATYLEQERFLIILTYTMIFSMLFANTLLMFLSRYISDCIYEKKYENILSSFYGTVSILLLSGGVLAGLFIFNLALPLEYKLIIFMQFCIVMIIWIQLTFLSAVKRYLKILYGFFIAVVISFLVALVCMIYTVEPLKAALIGSLSAYFIMMYIYMSQMLDYFPKNKTNLFVFVPALDQYKIFLAIGFFMTLGLYAHNFVIWTGEYGVIVLEKMRYSVVYDIPAFYACMTITPLLVIFVVSLEVNFYQMYKNYFDAVMYGGRLKDIQEAHGIMVRVLMRELLYMFQLQLFFTIFSVIFIANFLRLIGLNAMMAGIFRILCFGYAFYGLARCIIIILLYFDDRKGALGGAISFTVMSIVFTKLTLVWGINYYGLGFFAAAVFTTFFSLARLSYYLKNMEYYVFCKQPFMKNTKKGFFTKLVGERFLN